MRQFQFAVVVVAIQFVSDFQLGNSSTLRLAILDLGVRMEIVLSSPES